VKVATTKAQRKLFFNLRSHKTDAHTLSAGDGRAHRGQAERARASDVIEMETRLTGQDMALEPMSDDSDDDYGPISYLAAHNAEPTQVLERRDTTVCRAKASSRRWPRSTRAAAASSSRAGCATRAKAAR
jgi:RNA polymerase sigma-32 factor